MSCSQYFSQQRISPVVRTTRTRGDCYVCSSGSNGEAAAAVSSAIDRSLNLAKEQKEQTVKLLLVGCSSFSDIVPCPQPMHDKPATPRRASSVATERYRIDGIDFEVYTIATPFSPRWVRSLDHVDAIIVVASLADFDVYSKNQKKKSKLRERVDYVRSLYSHLQTDVSVILLLNDSEVMKEKLRTSPSSKSAFMGDNCKHKKGHTVADDFSSAILYYVDKFKHACHQKTTNDMMMTTMMMVHLTDTEDPSKTMEFLLDAIGSIILTVNLMQCGFLGGDYTHNSSRRKFSTRTPVTRRRKSLRGRKSSWKIFPVWRRSSYYASQTLPLRWFTSQQQRR